MSTYAISDIHGLWDKFAAFVDILKKDDVVYVLGDVVDRGIDGIKILTYIMDHPDQFKMLIGNHEHMMLNYLQETRGVNLEKASRWQLKQIRTLYDRWVLRNGGETTLTAYESLPEAKQEEVLQFIKNLPIAYTNLKIGDNTFYLVHSTPGDSKKDVVLQTDMLYPNEIHKYVWERPEFLELYYAKDRVVVSGHTMTYFHHGKLEVYISKDEEDNIRYIDIDCGCAMNSKDSKLAALCLDDLSIQYF